jgi:hypothetical protein
MEHRYVDNRPLSEEIRAANEMLAGRIVDAMKGNGVAVELTPLAVRS